MKKYKRYQFTKEEASEGGKKGGVASMKLLTKKQRRDKARKAAIIMWAKHRTLSTG